jgi:DNA invertase Pin-like site-specific DNA recombinase
MPSEVTAPALGPLAAIYARGDSAALIEWAERQGFSVAAYYYDLRKALRAAERHEFEVLLVPTLGELGDRIGDVGTVLQRISNAGIMLRCQREPWITPSDGPLLATSFHWVAQFQRSQRREQIREGQAKARRLGTRSGRAIGRPRLPELPSRDRLTELVRETGSIRKVGSLLGCDESTVRRKLLSRPPSVFAFWREIGTVAVSLRWAEQVAKRRPR